jgi:hypothetical protein
MISIDRTITHAAYFLRPGTLRGLRSCLTRLAGVADLSDSADVVRAIEVIPCSTKHRCKLRWAYRIFLEANGMKVNL